MSELSPNLSLPLIQAAQAQKHVTHNEAVELLDMIVQLTVQDFDATTPPALALEGQSWALAASPTGAWTGQSGTIASWRGGGWIFVTPQTGWQAWGVTPAQMRIYTGSAWDATTPAPNLQNLDGVGINASSDATNKLSIASDATLLSHDGGGHQLKLNKASAGDTASLLYQTNWSGRAEMGLAGNDDFAIKVSADGSTFADALSISKDTGKVSFPSGINGSGSAAGALGLQAMAFTCERNAGFSVGNILAFGNGGSVVAGPAMPFAGRVVAATLSIVPGGSGTSTVAMLRNKTLSASHAVSVTSNSAAVVDTGSASFAASPLIFAAGDTLAMEVTVSADASSKAVGTFFVIFD